MLNNEQELLVSDLKRIAPLMRKLDRAHDLPTYHFDSITESVIWDDEIPSVSERGAENFNGLRPVLRYRSSLILGEPENRWYEHWELAQQLFPEWIGFSPMRRFPNPILVPFLRDHIAKARKELEELLG